MRTASAPKLFFIGLLIIAAVAGITFGVGSLADVGDDGLPEPAAEPTPTSDPTLAPDQVVVSGVAAGITVDGAVIAELTIAGVTTPAAGLGAGARFEEVTVDGDTAAIAWDAGRPLTFAAATPLRLRPAPVNIAGTSAGMTVTFVDSSVHNVLPGDYEIDTPVAISTGGLGRPADSVAFTAADASTVAFTGGASAAIPPTAFDITGPGRVVLQGTLTVRRPDGTTATVTSIELPSGSFRLSFLPASDGSGYSLSEALLEGAVTVVEAPPA